MDSYLTSLSSQTSPGENQTCQRLGHPKIETHGKLMVRVQETMEKANPFDGFRVILFFPQVLNRQSNSGSVSLVSSLWVLADSSGGWNRSI